MQIPLLEKTTECLKNMLLVLGLDPFDNKSLPCVLGDSSDHSEYFLILFNRDVLDEHGINLDDIEIDAFQNG